MRFECWAGNRCVSDNKCIDAAPGRNRYDVVDRLIVEIGCDLEKDRQLIARCRPQSEYAIKQGVRVMIDAMDWLLVSVRENSSSTQENMKQKNAATPMPLAISGMKMRMKKRGNE